MIRRLLRPPWDSTLLHSVSTEDVTRWENALPEATGISLRTARAARTLLGTILGDAAATRPPLIPRHPRSPLPLLDELLAPIRAAEIPAPARPRALRHEPMTPDLTSRNREKMISQIPPNQPAAPHHGRRNGGPRPTDEPLTWADTGRK